MSVQSIATMSRKPDVVTLLQHLDDQYPANLERTFVDETRSSDQNSLESGVPELIEEIQRIQDTITKERELGPAPPPYILSRSLFIHQMTHAREKYEDSMCQPQGTFREAYIGTEKYFSETPLDRLTRIAIGDMFVRKVHRGNYLLCRVIVPPTMEVAIELAVEDPEGDVRLLLLYNFPSMINAGPEKLDAIFPVGAVLAIREPYQKMSFNAENCFIRVDSPSDINFVDTWSPVLEDMTWKFGSILQGTPRFPSTASGWKDLGNKHFKASRWLCAAVAYTKGLSVEPTSPVLRANRAETYLRLEYYKAALADCEKVLEFPDKPCDVGRKVRLRAGKAEYGRGNFEAAMFHFNAFIGDSSKPNDADSWKLRAAARIFESKSGKHDWAHLFIESQTTTTALDVADYTGPIKVKSLSNRGGGRGVVATRNIKAGELLAVVKPFAAAFPEDIHSREKILAINLIKNGMDSQCQVLVNNRIINKLYGNPELHDQVYHLCPGPPYPAPPAPYPPPISCSRILTNPLDCGIYLDIALLENILSNNKFKPQPLKHVDFKRDTDELTSSESLSALYLLPSLFNHACAANASYHFFREVMVIRARVSITQGEEITIPYIWETSTFTRQAKLDGWNFKCTCWLCEEDRTDGEEQCRNRDALLESIRNLDQAKKREGFQVTKAQSHVTTEYLKQVIKAISTTYSLTHGSIRPHMNYIQHRLSHEFETQGLGNPENFREAIAMEVKAIEAAGIVVIDKSITGRAEDSRCRLPIDDSRGPIPPNKTCILQILMIVSSFLSLEDFQRAIRWLRAAWRLNELMTGGGRKLFEERFKIILEGTGISAFLQAIQDSA